MWISDKIILCEEFVDRDLPLVQIDEKFEYYTNIVKNMDSLKLFHDIGPIRVILKSLVKTVRYCAIDWKNTLGKIFIDKIMTNILNLQRYITVFAIFYFIK